MKHFLSLLLLAGIFAFLFIPHEYAGYHFAAIAALFFIYTGAQAAADFKKFGKNNKNTDVSKYAFTAVSVAVKTMILVLSVCLFYMFLLFLEFLMQLSGFNYAVGLDSDNAVLYIYAFAFLIFMHFFEKRITPKEDLLIRRILGGNKTGEGARG